MIHYDADIIQLTLKGMAIHWVARTTVEAFPENGEVCIEQAGEDTIVIPWCYLPEVIQALENARDELERYRSGRP